MKSVLCLAQAVPEANGNLEDEKQELKDEEMVIQKINGTYKYCRSLHAQNQALSNKLMTLYESSQCLITPSGMAAISTCMNGLANYCFDKNFYIYASNELYCDTPNLLDSIAFLHKNCKQLIKIDVTKSSEIVSMFTQKYTENKDENYINILFIESCTNPRGYIFDFSLIQTLKDRSKKLIVVVDNTWLTSVSFNPLKHGADIVVTSLTKYYGAGNAIAGAVTTSNNEYFKEIVGFSCLNGMHVSPLNCQIISNNMTTLENRIAISSNKTKTIIEKYASRIPIIHPMLENHPSNNLAKMYLKYWPSVLVFKAQISKNEAIKAMSNNNHIEYKTSFGSNKSRFDTYPKLIDGFTHCRLAIGYANDDSEHLMNGIEDFVTNVENVITLTQLHDKIKSKNNNNNKNKNNK
jgi:cystathionine beta-lyase/cystathionine gamma-synthase